MRDLTYDDMSPPVTVRAAYTPDGHYIGDEDFAKHLDERGIAPALREGCGVCSIGFNEAEQKWYGWSHRAMFGFGVGSVVSKGDCAYTASTPEEMIEDRGEFFRSISEECAQQHMNECEILPDRSGIRILHAPLLVPMAQDFEQLHDAIATGSDAGLEVTDIMDGRVSIQKCGRGEWTAQTLDDARQMAEDFAESVS